MVKTAALTALLSLGVASASSAATISYTVNVGDGTLNHAAVPVAILEVGALGQTSFDFANGAFVLNATGSTTITHTVGFDPVYTLIVGDDPSATRTEILMFMDPTFGYAHAGIRWDHIFLTTGHNAFTTEIAAAEAGDTTAQDALLGFLTGEGAPAAFASNGPNLGVEFSPAVILTPEPSTIVLVGTALAGALAYRRRQKTAR